MNPTPEKVQRKDTNFLLCLICQQNTNEQLVVDPIRHNKVLDFIRELAIDGDRNYPEISRRIGDVTAEYLHTQGATWHRSCYQATCHQTMCRRAKERYEKQVLKEVQCQPTKISLPPTSIFTRSQTTPYDKNVCFFCEEKSTKRNSLKTITTNSAGLNLRSAIAKSNNDKFRVKLGTALNLTDGHAIDIRYHNKCWLKHVVNILRPQHIEVSECNEADEIAANIEFLSLVNDALVNGEILSMSSFHSAYVDIRTANCVANPSRYMSMQHHHENTNAKTKLQEKNVADLTETVNKFTNPFTDKCKQLINIVTKAVMPEKVQEDVSRRTQIGQKHFAQFVTERINSNNRNFWAPMKKLKLHMWSSTGYTTRTKSGDKLIELKEDRALFARMLIVSKARNIDLKHAIGTYEFSIVPRALFAADGSLLPTTSKSDLFTILESLPKEASVLQKTNSPSNKAENKCKRVAVVDGMADIQSLDKPECIKTCLDLATHFIFRHWLKYSNYDEVHLVFDRYDLGVSMKDSTRERRLSGNKAVAYHITDSTQIANISMQRLLAHVATKDALTTYLAGKILHHGVIHNKNVVVAWRDKAQATHRDVTNIESSQEEADTKLILHSINATMNGATTIDIYSPDTDVFVLAIRRYPSLCPNTNFVTGTGKHSRTISILPIYKALGAEKASALPGLHAFSGADITGRFSGKGKATFWKVMQELQPNDEIVNAFKMLGTRDELSEVVFAAIESFVCKLYVRNTELTHVSDVRWWLFKKKQAQSEGLPPTQGALRPAILRAHYQAIIWNRDIVANPTIPDAHNFGWELVDGHYKAVMTHLPPAPQAVIDLVKCSCTKNQCTTNHCKCKKHGLSCTDLCSCCEEEVCENAGQTCHTDEEDSDTEDELDY